MPDLSKVEETPARINMLERQLMALQLRKQGGTYRQIAQTLRARQVVAESYDMRAAHRDVKAAYKLLRERVAESAEDSVVLDLERVDELLSKIYPRALALDYVAFDRVVTLLGLRARYLGLFKTATPAGQVNVQVADGERTMVVQMHWPDMPPPAPLSDADMSGIVIPPGMLASPIGEGEATGVLPREPGKKVKGRTK